MVTHNMQRLVLDKKQKSVNVLVKDGLYVC